MPTPVRPIVSPLPPGPAAISIRDAVRSFFESIHDLARDGQTLDQHPALPFDPAPYRRLRDELHRCLREVPAVLVVTGEEDPVHTAGRLVVAVAEVRAQPGWCEEEWAVLTRVAPDWTERPIWFERDPRP